MPTSTEAPALSKTAVIVFEPERLPRLIDTAEQLGFFVRAFNDAEEALVYVRHPETSVGVVIASGTIPRVLNGSDLATQLSASYRHSHWL